MTGSIRRRSGALLGLVALAAFVGACSSGAVPAPLSKAGNPAAQPAASGGSEAARASAGATGDSAAYSSGSTQYTQQDVLQDSAYIVKTGTMTVEVQHLDAALLAARAAITGLGGYIAGSQQVNSDDRSTASITFRVPVARWEEALDVIRKLDSAKLMDMQTNSVEVTGQVLDIGARIDNLRATERQLQLIMGKAVKIGDILEVQSKLTDVQGQIEQLSTQQSHLKQQAALSTLAVVFSTPAPKAVTETSKGWDPSAELDHAVAQLLGLGQSLATGSIWFGIVWLPVLIGLGLIALVIRFAMARLGIRRRPDDGPGAEPAIPAA